MPTHLPPAALHHDCSFNDATTSSPLQLFDQIAYCSVATLRVGDLGLAQTVAALNDGTAQHGASKVTGLLMWEERLMIHWLEGSSDTLDLVWSHIENDTRQHCVVPLLRRRGAGKRLFENWTAQRTSRNEMLAIVREAKAQTSKSADPQTLQWQHAISTLSILLDSDLTACYAQAAIPIEPTMVSVHV